MFLRAEIKLERFVNMNKREDLLDAISERINKKIYKKCLSGISDESLLSLLYALLRYYEVNDYETSNIHSKIFKALYIDNISQSYDEVAKAFNIHVYTLDRYRQRYNKLAKEMIAQEQTVNFKIS